jgi:3-phenylpropionate/trans-cinnamate dioxygenase ferredoxin subunit
VSVEVCKLADLAPNSATKVIVEGRPVSLIRIGDDVYAIGDTCSHAEVSLSEGELFCDTKEIECWKHGSLFSIETGEALTLPATQPVPVYAASVVEDAVFVAVEPESMGGGAS